MFKMKRILPLLLTIIIFSALANAEEIFVDESHIDHMDQLNNSDHVDLFFFHSPGCPHCANMRIFLDEMEDKYQHLIIHEYNINQNIGLFFDLADKYGLDVSDGLRVPVIFIHEKVIVGENEDIKKSLEDYIGACIGQICIKPTGEEKIEDVTQTIGSSDIAEKNPTSLEKLTLPAVISAAAVDAINPCAFAVLIILITTILATHSKKKALLAGLAFSLSIYISYFMMGVGLYSAIQVAGLTRLFYIIVAILAILVGLFNLKDFLWYGKWFVMEVPLSWRPKMKSLIKGVTSVPGAFLVGFLVSLFLLPCTSGPYIVILGLLAHSTTKNYAFLLLLLYNFIFIIPMLAITLAIYFGFTTTEKAEKWRTKKLKILHLIAGLIILALGILMLIGVIFGVI